MREERTLRGIVHGARCPGRVLRGLPCPGRLLLVRDSSPGAGWSARYRCNGPDAHEVEAHAPVAAILPEAFHAPPAEHPQMRWF